MRWAMKRLAEDCALLVAGIAMWVGPRSSATASPRRLVAVGWLDVDSPDAIKTAC